MISLIIWVLLCGNPGNTGTGINGGVTTMDTGGDIGHIPPTPPPPPPPPHQ